MAGQYAQDTSVSVSKSKEDIERVLRRYGASKFASGWDEDSATIAFEASGRMVRFVVTLPQLSDFALSPAGRKRTAASQMASWEQASRSIWRSLKLCIQAKMEAIAAGIATFDDEFLAYLVLGDGRTVSEHVAPSLNNSISTPRQLMLGSGS